MKTCYVDKETRGIADLCEISAHTFLITRINTPVASRGQGVARKLLQQILEDADREHVLLCLEISPSDGLAYNELEAWYFRHGFALVEMNFYQRRPKV